MILPASLIDARARAHVCVLRVCVYSVCVCVARARVCAAEEAGRGWGVGRARTAMGGRMGGEGTARVTACEREGEGEDAGQGRGRVRSRSGGSAAGEGGRAPPAGAASASALGLRWAAQKRQGREDTGRSREAAVRARVLGAAGERLGSRARTGLPRGATRALRRPCGAPCVWRGRLARFSREESVQVCSQSVCVYFCVRARRM